MNERLNHEVREFLSRGKTPEQIRVALEANGWLDTEIDEALADVLEDMHATTPMPGAPVSGEAATPTPEEAPIASFSMPEKPEPQAPDVTPPSQADEEARNDPPAEPPSAAPQAPTTEKISRPVMLPKRPVLIMGLLAVLVAAGAAGYFWYNSPSKIAGRAYDRMLKVRTVQFSAESIIRIVPQGDTNPAEADTKPGPAEENPPSRALLRVPHAKAAEGDAAAAGESTLINLKFDGSVDARDPKNIAGELKMNADTDFGGTKYRVAGEARLKDHVAYGRLTEIPKNEFLPGIELFKNIWVMYDLKEFEKQLAESGTTLDLSDAKLEQVKKALSKHNPVRVTKRFKAEKIDGIPSRHFEYQLDKEKSKKAFPEIYRIITSKDMTAEELEALNKSIDEQADTKTEVWLGKSDNLIHRMRSESTSDVEHVGKVTVSSAQAFRNYDKPVELRPPDGAVSFDQLDKESRADTDKDGLLDLWERYFGSNPKKPDTDGDKFKDGAEILGGYDPTGRGRLTGEKKAFAETYKKNIRSGTPIGSTAR